MKAEDAKDKEPRDLDIPLIDLEEEEVQRSRSPEEDDPKMILM